MTDPLSSLKEQLVVFIMVRSQLGNSRRGEVLLYPFFLIPGNILPDPENPGFIQEKGLIRDLSGKKGSVRTLFFCENPLVNPFNLKSKKGREKKVPERKYS